MTTGDVELQRQEEKQEENEFAQLSAESSSPSYSSNPIVHRVQQVSRLLDSFGAESRGLERVLPNERAESLMRTSFSIAGLWLSGCGGLTSMSSFFLGPLLYGLDFKSAMTCAIPSLTLGCLFSAYCSTMGPRSGLRQMVGARFLFGYWFIKFVALVLIISLLGWSVTNCVLGGQILTAVSSGKVPIEIGIVLISIVTFIVTVFGIKHLLRAETFFAIPVFIALILLYVCTGDKLSQYHDTTSYGDSLTIKGDFLSFFTLSYSVTATWGSISSDYYVLFPETCPFHFVFGFTFIALLLPTTFGAVISIIISNAATAYEPWNTAYEDGGLGGLLMAVFDKWGGGGKFLLMVMWLSLISNNIVNTYSSAFGVQLAGIKLNHTPRWLLALGLTAATLICSLVGRNKFSVILGNFLPMIGYWFSMYFMMLVEENFIFRTKAFIHLYTAEFTDKDSYGSWPYYNFEIWDDFSRLTHGIASTISFLIGVAGAVLGMAQAYYIGPVAKNFGEYGGDVAMWLSMAFVAVSYPGLRYLELKKFGR